MNIQITSEATKRIIDLTGGEKNYCFILEPAKAKR